MSIMKLTRYLTALLMIVVNLFNYTFNDYAYPAVSTDGAYLFCYFVGNEADEQTIHLAISTDGYNFEALNDNKPIITQTQGTGCVRDPYIFQAVDENGKACYYIVATDMNALEGWTSNHRIIFWKSYDLINWEDEYLLDMRDFEGFENCNRAWAPQVIWDEAQGKYMLYLALSEYDDPETPENEDIAQHYYLYTSDFKSFTQPEYLYGRRTEVVTTDNGSVINGVQCIDGDMIYNEKDGCYYLYFKEDLTQKIAYVKSKSATGPFEEPYTVCSLNWWGVEGSTMYRITGTNAWMMIMDEYGEGTFFAQMTRDFKNFRQVQRSKYSLNHLNPRHGSVMAISEEQYYCLADTFGVQKLDK